MAALIRKNIFRNGAVSHSNLKNSAGQLVSYRGFTSKLFVKGVSFSTTKEMLADAFSQFGQVTKATIIMDKGKNTSKGYGSVTFSTEAEAQKALTEMNGKLLDGRVLFVDNVRPSRRYNTDVPLARLKIHVAVNYFAMCYVNLYAKNSHVIF
ncbi:RRM domain-containing protein [Citrus sinensis]|uniref:RRM domain-containing protein n=1 Tax=Citrus sinensis TaxID=2711 RepID=A0ACB8M0S6_CITSI|nr:RRM domain-containing protein [Citrus sinensis]